MWCRPDNGRDTIDAYTTKEQNTAFFPNRNSVCYW